LQIRRASGVAAMSADSPTTYQFSSTNGELDASELIVSSHECEEAR
jgi:hypothetical protein